MKRTFAESVQRNIIEYLQAENDRLRVALEIYAKPENWKPHKTQHRRIWIYHCYEDGFKIAQAALRPEQSADDAKE